MTNDNNRITSNNMKKIILSLAILLCFSSCNAIKKFLSTELEDEDYIVGQLYADEMVPYKNVVEILNVANENHFKMILATRPPEK